MDIARLLEADGPLAGQLPGFAPRPQQQAMARAVEAALRRRQVLLVEAYEADVVVINHYLLFADLVLKEDGFGELLPGADAFILDEAHQLPEVAGHFFGFSLSSRQLDDLARDTLLEQRRDAPDFPALAERVYALGKATADLRLALGQEIRRAAWRKVATLPALVSARRVLEHTLAELHQHLQPAAARGKGLENCWRRSLELAARLSRLTGSTATAAIPWFETYSRSFSLNLTPLDVAPHFRACLQKYPVGWILTSATLAVGDSFAHFSARLGLDHPLTLRLDSPFDFARHALLYHPPGLPEPASPRYTAAMIEGVASVLAASRGRAFGARFPTPD